MKLHKIPEQKCPYCGYVMNATTILDSPVDLPRENVDISVCLKCGEVSLFGEGLLFRKLTPEETIKYSNDERIQVIHRRILNLNRRRL